MWIGEGDDRHQEIRTFARQDPFIVKEIKISRKHGGVWGIEIDKRDPSRCSPARDSKNPVGDWVFVWTWGFYGPEFVERVQELRDWISQRQREPEPEPEPLDFNHLVRETLFGVNGQGQVSVSAGKLYRLLREANPQFADEYCVSDFSAVLVQ